MKYQGQMEVAENMSPTESEFYSNNLSQLPSWISFPDFDRVDWINQILHPTNGKTYQLVYHYKKSSPIRETRIGYYKAYPETWKKTDFATCSFSTAATIITWPSIEDINEKMNKEYNHLRYRCNIVVNPVDNTPYQEDNWRKIR